MPRDRDWQTKTRIQVPILFTLNQESFAVSAISLLSLFPRAGAARAAIVLSFILSVGFIYAQQGGYKQPPSVGEKTSEAFARLKPMQDAKDWDGMLKMLESIPGVKPGSYDEALILDTKAKIHGLMEQYSKVLHAWERALEISDQHGYFPDGQTLEIVGYLAQLHAQEAAATKDPKLQQQHFTKSLLYFRRSLEKTRKPTPEAMMTYASILFQKATADPTNIDQALLGEAREITDEGLMMSLRPKETFYHLRLALLQQENDFAGASDLIELLLKQKPDHKDYWQALVNIYLQLSLKAKDEDPTLSREYLVRAIVTFERAQSLGFLTTPKDNLDRVSLYLTANQFTKGTEILHQGMKNGTIESEPNNWRLLGHYYQEANLYKEAVSVLREGAARFPDNSEIEVQLAHLCIQMESTLDALQHARAAVAKGSFETTKPFSVHNLIAYTAYDLGELEEAQNAIAAAEGYPEEVSKDAQFPTLKAVITEAIAERERKAAEQARRSGAADKTTARAR